MASKPLIILIIFSSLLSACRKSSSPSGDILQETVVGAMPKADEHATANSVNWDGTYIGVVPCADCEGIKTSVKLNRDFSWEVKAQYLGKYATFERKGTFKWNEGGNSILLNEAVGIPDKYFVGENILIQLDKEGKKIAGALSEKYILKKISAQEESLTGEYWKLTELMGKSISKNSGNNKEKHLKFDIMNHKVNGFAGCNNFFGSYKLEGSNKLNFYNVGSTKMACLEGTFEEEFLKMMSMVDSYEINGDTLVLHKAKMSPLAKFELIKQK